MITLDVNVNGRSLTSEVEPRLSLADFLREKLALTGTHLGCEHGVCGSCTVLLDDEPIRGCITLAVAANGRRVRTIEGFETDELMGALRQKFTQAHALQCGFCTPGMLITCRDVLLRFKDADADRIRRELSGNICRCTGYAGIVEAVQLALIRVSHNDQ